MNAHSPRHFVRMYKPRFARLVETRAKRQTVRPRPKRMPRPGDTQSNREWVGKPYRSKQRVLCESTIIGVHRCDIAAAGVAIDGTALPLADVEKFAVADGFTGWAEMREWFTAEHGLPFSGVLICWQ